MMTPEYVEVTLGKRGGATYGDTASHTGNWRILQAVTAIEINTITEHPESDWTGTSALQGVLIPAGNTIYGHFTQIELTSGVVRMYNK